LVYPEFATATLEVLGKYQATERDDHRDAEPGKIMHELRLGELAHFKAILHTPTSLNSIPLRAAQGTSTWRCVSPDLEGKTVDHRANKAIQSVVDLLAVA
jgi:hypothetical protein